MDQRVTGGYGSVVIGGGVAKKTIAADLWESAVRELAYLMALKSTYVVKLYEFSFGPKAISLTLEQADGDLCDWVAGNPGLPARQAVEAQILAAVAYVHSRGVIHADIKPANILVFKRSSPPTVKLCDFGISVPANERTHRGPLQTITYRAPEAPTEPKNAITEKADVWSVGCVLWYLYSGHTLIPYKKTITDSAIQTARFFRVSRAGPREAVFNRLCLLTRAQVEARLCELGQVDRTICAHVAKFLLPDPEKRAPLGVKIGAYSTIVNRQYLDDLLITNHIPNIDNYSTILLSLADSIHRRSGADPMASVDIASCIYFTEELPPGDHYPLLNIIASLKGHILPPQT